MSNTFQDKVVEWANTCFPEAHVNNKSIRNLHFLEEAIELTQATGLTRHEAHKLVNQVYDKRTGKASQEVGGVLVTLALLCHANKLVLDECGQEELDRIWNTINSIRTKPKHQPT